MNDLTPHDPGISRMKSEAKEYKAAMILIWTQGLISFGGKWRNDFGEVGELVFNSWARSLCASFDPETLKSGGPQILSQWPDPFPPTLGQFRSAMLLEAKSRRQGARKEALPNPEGQDRIREIAERELDRMYSILGTEKPSAKQIEEKRNERRKPTH